MVAIDIQEWSTTEMEEEVREEEEEEISVFEYEQEDQEEQNHKANDERETDNIIDTTKWDEYYLLSIEMKPRITEEETNEEEDEEENNNEEQAIKTFKHEDHEQTRNQRGTSEKRRAGQTKKTHKHEEVQIIEWTLHHLNFDPMENNDMFPDSFFGNPKPKNKRRSCWSQKKSMK